MARQFTQAPLAISFFGSSFYERYARKNTLKIPVNTGNFTKKENPFPGISCNFAESITKFLGLFRSFKKPSLSKQPFPDDLQNSFPKYSDAANGSVSRTPFLIEHLRATGSQHFAKFTGKYFCESVYFIKFQNVNMQPY